MSDPESVITPKNPVLADVAFDAVAEGYAPLEWVGMSEIELPVLLSVGGRDFMQAARLEAFVNLQKAGARGIHMSRLYLLAQDKLTRSKLGFETMAELLGDFLGSHAGLSSSARLRVRADLPVLRPALKTANAAWRTYPASWIAERHPDGDRFEFEVLITYSSTCPASAALSRQLIQEKFKSEFVGRTPPLEEVHEWLGTTQGIVATPHAQRSEARVRVRLHEGEALDVIGLIDLLESALGTPVQAAVKREDEQEFALRNGQNLMFCEDAARRLGLALERAPGVADFLVRVQHIESLHPHNAVASIRKAGSRSPLQFD